MNMRTFMCTASAAISLAASAPACAAWTEGTAGRLLEKCHAFSELVQRNGRAKDSQELADAGDCRKYIEGFFDGFTSERFKTGGRDHNQKICMPETGSHTIIYKDAIFYITSQIEGMPNTWGDSARSDRAGGTTGGNPGKYPWCHDQCGPDYRVPLKLDWVPAVLPAIVSRARG